MAPLFKFLIAIVDQSINQVFCQLVDSLICCLICNKLYIIVEMNCSNCMQETNVINKFERLLESATLMETQMTRMPELLFTRDITDYRKVLSWSISVCQVLKWLHFKHTSSE